MDELKKIHDKTFFSALEIMAGYGIGHYFDECLRQMNNSDASVIDVSSMQLLLLGSIYIMYYGLRGVKKEDHKLQEYLQRERE